MQRTRSYFFIALGLFAVHLLEEVMTQFPALDPVTLFSAALLRIQPIILFIGIQLIGLCFLIIGTVWASKMNHLLLRGVLALLCLSELTHLVPALNNQRYYPGAMSAIGLVLFGLFLGWSVHREPRKTSASV